MPGPVSAKDLDTVQRLRRMVDRKGHFVQVWGSLIGPEHEPSAEINPAFLCLMLPVPEAQGLTGCGKTLSVTAVPETPSCRCSSLTNEGLL